MVSDCDFTFFTFHDTLKHFSQWYGLHEVLLFVLADKSIQRNDRLFRKVLLLLLFLGRVRGTFVKIEEKVVSCSFGLESVGDDIV